MKNLVMATLVLAASAAQLLAGESVCCETQRCTPVRNLLSASVELAAKAVAVPLKVAAAPVKALHNCCEKTACQPAPVACEPAPVACQPAPVACESACAKERCAPVKKLLKHAKAKCEARKSQRTVQYICIPLCEPVVVEQVKKPCGC
jgi:hypothetical protein